MDCGELDQKPLVAVSGPKAHQNAVRLGELYAHLAVGQIKKSGWAMRLGFSIKVSLAMLGLLAFSACHDDDEAPAPPVQPATYTIGGTLSGLAGSITLANNGGDSPRSVGRLRHAVLRARRRLM